MKPIEIDEKQCQDMYDNKKFKRPSGRGGIEEVIRINAINRLSYYEQGYQVASHDIDGSQIMRGGEDYMFSGKRTVTHIVVY